MAIEFTKAEASNLPALYDTLLAFWDQSWSTEFQEEFLSWRYGRRTDGETLVAMSGSKCVGLLDTFIRPYLVGGREVMVREPCDWYCQPDKRGVGMRLLRMLIAQGDPLLGVGVAKGAVPIAPRMKWTRLLDAHDFALPITARRAVGSALRKARLGDGALAKYIPRGIALRPSSAWRKHGQTDGVVTELAAAEWPADDWASGSEKHPYALTPILTNSYVAWLGSGPQSLGKVFCLAFRVSGALVGLTICRIEASKVGRKARLIHLQAFAPSVPTLRWMISENIQRAVRLDAESVHCRSTCPLTNAALASLHFHAVASEAVLAGFNGTEIPPGPVNMSFVRGDDAMIPSLIAE